MKMPMMMDVVFVIFDACYRVPGDTINHVCASDALARGAWHVRTPSLSRLPYKGMSLGGEPMGHSEVVHKWSQP